MSSLPKYQVLGDPKNVVRYSSKIIIDSLNEAAKACGLYSDSGLKIVYDCIGNHHGHSPDALIVCYEIPFPPHVLNNVKDKPVIGISRDNMFFARDGGHPAHLCNYTPLGVDSKLWVPIKKSKMMDKFVIMSYTESMARSGLDILINAFYNAFGDRQDVVLYIKDRNADPLFIEYIAQIKAKYNLNIIHDNRHLTNPQDEREVLEHADCHFYLNRSTTWGMTVCQSMAAGIPTVSPAYSGPREYILDGFSGIAVEYDVVPVEPELPILAGVGMRSHFFPTRPTDYWCKPRIKSVIDAMKRLQENKDDLRGRLSQGGIDLGRRMTWERAAANLSVILKEFGL